MSRKSRIYFDKEDGEILRLVNSGLASKSVSALSAQDPHLHPHGIKEMVDTPAARMAFAVANLLHNLETGGAQARERVEGLRILFDEVMSSAHSSFRRNTARVLLQIMKSMVRARGNEMRQLKLAHDFRRAAQGTPRIVRRLLKRYYLPEMSEEWDQLAFDDHVYDMYTKGRKTPTHLVMDAWIKGLRKLTVVYDNSLTVEAAEELLGAAAIVGIEVRVALEYRVPFRGRFVSLLWEPRGFTSSRNFLDFLRSSKMTALLARGRAVVDWEREKILESLAAWNDTVRLQYEEYYGITIDPLSVDDFLLDVGRAHAGRAKLAESIAKRVRSEVDRRYAELCAAGEKLTQEESVVRDELATFCTAFVENVWLCDKTHPELPCIADPNDMDGMPEILKLSPAELVQELSSINAGYRMVLCTAGLHVEDVMELLWDCRVITHLEIFNMRGWMKGEHHSIKEIGELQEALNKGQGPRLKQMIRQMIRTMEEAGDTARAEKFDVILGNIPTLWEHYTHAPLKSRAGTGSASRSRTYGMGLVMLDSLPAKGRKFLKKQVADAPAIPVQAPIKMELVCSEPEAPDAFDKLLSRLRFLPGCSTLGLNKTRSWSAARDHMRVSDNGNIANLGGMYSTSGAPVEEEGANTKGPGRKYLNSHLLNCLKVFIGFLPAFISFQITQQWWFLAWFGVAVWFSITGIRNVIQMVMAAKGFSRNKLIHWSDTVNVSRLCDSLMFTGFSVFLLEFLCRYVILGKCLGVTVTTHPIFVFSFIGCLNGFYIFSHNMFRGFPFGAAFGNLFRWILSVPIAWLYNYILLQIVLMSGAPDPSYYIDPSATILSKMASDTIAGVIEGFVDSRQNMRVRKIDLHAKIDSIIACYTHLELLFPKEDILVKLAKQGGLNGRGGEEGKLLERAFIVNALDMMYIWLCQPRARDAFKQIVNSLSTPDRKMLATSQLVLMREQEVSQLMVDGLVGRDFSRPLSFYLSNRRQYLDDFLRLCRAGNQSSAKRLSGAA